MHQAAGAAVATALQQPCDVKQYPTNKSNLPAPPPNAGQTRDVMWYVPAATPRLLRGAAHSNLHILLALSLAAALG
jgi:hypothetical protein